MTNDQQMGQLTETDVAALRAYLFEPVAEIKNPLRATTNLNAHEFLISGIKVKSYAYQFGLADTLDCQNLEHYSPQRSIDQPLKVSFSELGRYKICLLGSDGTQTQSPKAYTSYVWTKTQSSLSIDSNITLLPHHSSAPLAVRSLQDKVWVKIVQTKDKDTCSQGEGYQELPTQNLRVSPGDWIQDWSNDFEAVICVSESMTDFTDVAFEHIILLFDGIDFIGLSSGISEGDVVKAIPNNFDHFFTHFRYALVSEAALCRDPGTQYSEIRVVGQPVIFNYDSLKTKFICGMGLDRFGHWTKLEHAFAQDLLKPVD